MSQYLPHEMFLWYLPSQMTQMLHRSRSFPIRESLGTARHLKLHQDHPLDFEWSHEKMSCWSIKVEELKHLFVILFWDPWKKTCTWVVYPWYARGPAGLLVKATLKNRKKLHLWECHTQKILLNLVTTYWTATLLATSQKIELNNQILLKLMPCQNYPCPRHFRCYVYIYIISIIFLWYMIFLYPITSPW